MVAKVLKRDLRRRDDEFFKNTELEGTSATFLLHDQPESTIFPPRRNALVRANDGWYWHKNEGEGIAKLGPEQSMSELADRIIEADTDELWQSGDGARLDIDIVDFSLDDFADFISAFSKFKGINFIFVEGSADFLKYDASFEISRSSTRSKYGTRLVLSQADEDGFPGLNDVGDSLFYQLILTNSWSAESGGPMELDGSENFFCERDTNRYFVSHHGDSLMDFCYYLGDCDSLKEAQEKMVSYSNLWELDEKGNLLDIAPNIDW